MVNGNQSPDARSCCRRNVRSERGAAVFLVVLVVSLLTAMGIFALRSASLADVAAGFDREGAQASLIAQYGVTATAAYVGTGVADTIIAAMKNPSALGYIMPRCESNGYPMTLPQLTPPPPCFKIGQATLQTSFSQSGGETIFAPTNKGAGVATSTSSLNVNEATDATFNVELTDIATTGVPLSANEINVQIQYEVTLTSMAQVRPIEACTGAVPATPNAAQSVVRSIITLGGHP